MTNAAGRFFRGVFVTYVMVALAVIWVAVCTVLAYGIGLVVAAATVLICYFINSAEDVSRQVLKELRVLNKTETPK